MKKFALLVVALVVILFSLGATQEQSLIMPVLVKLKFEFVPPLDGRVGGPMEFKVTKETLEYLKALRAKGKVIILDNDGSVRIQ